MWSFTKCTDWHSSCPEESDRISPRNYISSLYALVSHNATSAWRGIHDFVYPAFRVLAGACKAEPFVVARPTDRISGLKGSRIFSLRFRFISIWNPHAATHDKQLQCMRHHSSGTCAVVTWDWEAAQLRARRIPASRMDLELSGRISHFERIELK